jgi:hypothetical protein
MTTTKAVNAVLRSIGLEMTLTTSPDDAATVSRGSIPAADARRAVAALTAAGIEASSAPDHDDRGREWLYVTVADEAAVEAAIMSLLADSPDHFRDDDGDYVIHVSDNDEDEGTETLEALRRLLPAGWSADWTGDGNSDGDGYHTSDIRITRDS